MITYNGNEHFEEQLSSILRQSLPCEINIYDDHSNQRFTEQIDTSSSRYPNVTVHLSEKNQGVIRNIKRALKDTKTPYLALADQDDVWLPDKVKTTLEFMKSVEESGVPVLVHHDMGVIDSQGQLKPHSFWEVMGQKGFAHNFETSVVMNLVTGCASLINNELTKYAKDIPEDLDIYHDAWIGMVAYTMGKTVSINQVLSHHRQHPNSLTFHEKTKPSIYSRLKRNSLQLLGLQKTFEAQFPFIERFLEVYYSQLGQYHKEYLKSFLSLKRKSYWSQKKFIWKALSSNKP